MNKHTEKDVVYSLRLRNWYRSANWQVKLLWLIGVVGMFAVVLSISNMYSGPLIAPWAVIAALAIPLTIVASLLHRSISVLLETVLWTLAAMGQLGMTYEEARAQLYEKLPELGQAVDTIVKYPD